MHNENDILPLNLVLNRDNEREFSTHLHSVCFNVQLRIFFRKKWQTNNSLSLLELLLFIWDLNPLPTSFKFLITLKLLIFGKTSLNI
jgi:hypothetical protein